MKYILIFTLAAFVNSCIVVHSGNISGGPLLSVTDKKVAAARGQARSVFVFGLGNADRDFLIEEAQGNLYVNRPLANDEYYSNFTCDIAHKVYFFGIVFINKTTISADVMSTIAKGPLPGKSPGISSDQKNTVSANYFINDVDSFNLGEIVYYESDDGSFGRYKIAAIERSEVYLESESGKSKFNVSVNQPIFSTKKSINNFSIGEIVKVKLFVAYDKAVIIALNTNKAVFKVDGKYYIKPISSLKKVQ